MIDQASVAESYDEYGRQAPEKKGGGFLSRFSGGGSSPKGPAPPVVGEDMMGQVRDVSRRLRLLEERYTQQRKHVQVMEHNMLAEHKKLQAKMRALQEDFDALRKQIYDMQQKFDLIGAELRDTARREDVVVLEKYINLWEPVQFVTRGEVEKLINFILDSKGKK